MENFIPDRISKFSDLEMFDTVIMYLISQGQKSTTEDVGICAYRGMNDTKCAVGFLINDEAYSPYFEHQTVHEDDIVEAIIKSNPDWDNDLSVFDGYSYPEPSEGKSLYMLILLQKLHDRSLPEEWGEVSSFIRNSIFEDGKLKSIEFLREFEDNYKNLLQEFQETQRG